MTNYKIYEFMVHEAGKRLQSQAPKSKGLKIQQIAEATGLSWGTVCKALDALEEKGKARSLKTPLGCRQHGTIRLKGRLPGRKSA